MHENNRHQIHIGGHLWGREENGEQSDVCVRVLFTAYNYPTWKTKHIHGQRPLTSLCSGLSSPQEATTSVIHLPASVPLSRQK